ncbi:MAG: GGDEF domain-containing protein [Leptospiraceae bacterium]|nr:GGDEF domain-containing protein [Leptospiraceae bacterium]
MSINTLIQIFRRFISKVKREYILDNSISNEISLINIERLFYIANFTIPVSFIHILLFYFKDVKSENELKWKTGVILVHSILFAFMIVFSYIIKILKHNWMNTTWVGFIEILFIIIILFSGITLVAVDQYVTTNITPFIVICIVIAISIFIRPIILIPVYLFAYMLFYYAIGIIQKQEDILLTNQVNAVSIIGISIFISTTLWRSKRTAIFQKREIQKQHEELLHKNRLLENANHELENLAILDELTQIYNRRYFNLVLEKEFRRHRRTQKKISLIICDVDLFKNYNDTLGHLEGDKCLKKIANTIRESINRPFDSAVRYGGEEFVVILPNTDEKGVMTVATRIKNKLSELSLLHPDSRISSFVTMSFGITTIIPNESIESENLLSRADEALFESKRTGRNKITRK